MIHRMTHITLGLILVVTTLGAKSATAGGCDGFSATYGVGKPGGNGVAPLLLSSTRPKIGNSIDLFVYQGLPGAFPLLLMGSTPTNLPFDGGALYVLPLLVNELPKLDGSGKVQIAIDIPNNPALCGAELRMQAIYLDPGASGFYHTAQTNGLWWKVAG